MVKPAVPATIALIVGLPALTVIVGVVPARVSVSAGTAAAIV